MIEPAKNGQNTYALLIWKKDVLTTMVILGGGILNYTNISVSGVFEVIAKLLGVYYVINMQYPAMYGVLDVIDRCCLTADTNATTRKRSKKQEPQAMAKFLKSYNRFVDGM